MKIKVSLLKQYTEQEQKKNIVTLEAHFSKTVEDRSSHILQVVFKTATHKFSFHPWQHNGTAFEEKHLLKHFEVNFLNSNTKLMNGQQKLYCHVSE